MLARVRSEGGTGRGRLRVYLGMAPGVGKTYAALQECHRRKARGTDVVAGFVEHYRRPQTEAQLGDLEVLPRKQIPYGGTTVEEMDTDAVIARRPRVVLVDELAHTNAPGMAHEKRFDDVADLLAAGIDVISTVNVQHLESLNDRVFELTGVRVRETIPDRVLLDADDVVLVDLTPAELQGRLRAGKVYPSERVDSALLNFFTTPNLSTLREVALREVAGAVDEHIPRPAPQPIGERVMVVAYPRRGAQRLVRHAWRGARRIGAELDVVCPEGRLDEEAVRQRDLVRALAVTLGAHFMPVADEGLAETVVALARERGVTRLAMAAPRTRGLLSRLRGDLLGAVLDELEGVDVLLVADRPEPDGERNVGGDR
jgi:two-component system sensor histidine kinase KdpD